MPLFIFVLVCIGIRSLEPAGLDRPHEGGGEIGEKEVRAPYHHSETQEAQFERFVPLFSSFCLKKFLGMPSISCFDNTFF